MNTTYKYDPEDIESLLMHKQFNELYPEEKEFVLRHVEGPDEYESLRQTLFLMRDVADQDEWLEPDPSIRKNLMAQFVREEKKGFFVWLNGLFAAPMLPSQPWYRKPAMQFAFASVATLVGVGVTWYYVSKNNVEQELATTDDNDAKDSSTQSPSEFKSEGTRNYADNLIPNVFPPAPAPVGETPPSPEIQYIPTEESAVDFSTFGNVAAGISESENEPYTFSVSSADEVSESPTPILKSESESVVQEKSITSKENQAKKNVKNEESADREYKDLEDAEPGFSQSEELEKGLISNGADVSVQTGVIHIDSTMVHATFNNSGASPSMNQTLTVSDAVTLYNTRGQVYYWNEGLNSSTSRNTSELQNVVAILFTAK